VNGSNGGESFWIAGEVFIDAEGERRKKGMFEGVSRLDDDALLLMGGLVDRNA
jgi:hypothetical protein